MKKELTLIQALCLLIANERKHGPTSVEQHLNNPSESWILKGLKEDLIEEITSLISILYGCEITHETFKNFLLNKEGSSVEESMIQKFLWASHNGLPIYICAEICRRHISKERRPSYQELDAMINNLKVYQAEHDPTFNKVLVNPEFIEKVMKKYQHNKNDVLIQLLMKPKKELAAILNDLDSNKSWNFLFVLDRSDEIQSALFQKIFGMMDKKNQADYLIDYEPDEKARKANPVKIAKAWLKESHLKAA